MADKIGLQTYAKSTGGGSGTATANRCTTRTVAVNFGCSIRGTYLNNQLVAWKNIAKDSYTYCTCNKECTCKTGNKTTCSCNTDCTCDYKQEKCTCDKQCTCETGNKTTCTCNTKTTGSTKTYIQSCGSECTVNSTTCKTACECQNNYACQCNIDGCSCDSHRGTCHICFPETLTACNSNTLSYCQCTGVAQGASYTCSCYDNARGRDGIYSAYICNNKANVCMCDSDKSCTCVSKLSCTCNTKCGCDVICGCQGICSCKGTLCDCNTIATCTDCPSDTCKCNTVCGCNTDVCSCQTHCKCNYTCNPENCSCQSYCTCNTACGCNTNVCSCQSYCTCNSVCTVENSK